MLTKRVIPCLDVKDSRVVKGTGFHDLRDAGDPVERASFYDEEGADEVVLLDVSASYEGRQTLLDIVRRTADVLFIPFMVGGGITTREVIRDVLSNGADKIAINTAAVNEPTLIRAAADAFGSQCIVTSIDVKRVYVASAEAAPGKVVVATPQGKCWWDAYIYGGRKPVGIDAVQWAEMAVALGAGEIMASSLDFDGTRLGYDTAYLQTISERVNVPLIASSGAGTPKHMLDALEVGRADAVLAAGIFHYGAYRIRDVKRYLARHNVPVRL